MNRNSWQQTGLDYGAVLGRWLLGVVFLYTGLHKALHPEVFLKLIDQYQVVSNTFMLNTLAATLPWFEVFCGLLLLSGVAVRGTALMLILMLVPFTIIVLRRAIALAGAKGLALCAVKFDCGCGMGEVFACRKVIENCLLLGIAAWLLAGRGNSFALRFGLFRAKPSEDGAANSVESELGGSAGSGPLDLPARRR